MLLLALIRVRRLVQPPPALTELEPSASPSAEPSSHRVLPSAGPSTDPGVLPPSTSQCCT
jgi:hypothetical protein